MGEFDFPFMHKQKTMEELQADNERLKMQAENEDLKLTVEQKQYAFSKLREAGLNYKRDFGSSMKRLWKWANK